jgi:hypothetical protein
MSHTKLPILFLACMTDMLLRGINWGFVGRAETFFPFIVKTIWGSESQSRGLVCRPMWLFGMNRRAYPLPELGAHGHGPLQGRGLRVGLRGNILAGLDGANSRWWSG